MKPSSKTIKRTKFIGLEALNFAVRPIHTSLVSLLVIRLIDVALWGNFVFYLLSIELIAMILNWGQRAYLMREFSLQPQHIAHLLSVTLLARIPLFIGSILLIALVPDYRIYFLSLLVWLTFKWLANLFESVIKYNRTYLRSIIAEFFAMLSAIGYLLSQYNSVGIHEIIIAFAIASVVRFAVLSPLLKNLKVNTFTKSELKANLKVAFPLLLLSIAGLLQLKGDLYTATYLLDTTELAHYQVIVSFLILGQTVAWIILGPFQKNIYRWKEGNLKNLKKKYLLIGFLITSVFSLTLFLGLNLFYQIYLPYWYIFLFFTYVFPMYIYLIESQLLLKYKQENVLLKWSAISAGISIGLSFILIPLIGIVGAFISGIFCRLFLAQIIVKKASTILNKELN